MDALENPAKVRIQQVMNKIDVEKIVKERVIEFEKKGMNMSMNFDFKFWTFSKRIVGVCVCMCRQKGS